MAPFCDTLLSGPKPDCTKAHLYDSDLKQCSRWVHPIPGKKWKGSKKNKMWRRNSPWYSLKFTSTATPSSLCSSFPSLSLFFFSPSSVCSNKPSSRLVASLHASLDCPWSFWWIHKTCCILDWDGAVEKTRVMEIEKKKAISTTRGWAERQQWRRWRSECVWEWWDAEITRERGERMRVAAIGFAILIYGAEILKKGRWALQIKAGFPLVKNDWRAHYWKSCHLWTRTTLFLTHICPLYQNPWREGQRHSSKTPRIRLCKGLQLFSKATWRRKTTLNSLVSFIQCVYLHELSLDLVWQTCIIIRNYSLSGKNQIRVIGNLSVLHWSVYHIHINSSNEEFVKQVI